MVQGEVVQQLIAGLTVEAKLHSGPLPPASELAEYEEVLPGAADRIFRMAEGQSEHRSDLESRMLQQEGQRSLGGIVAGTVLTLGFEGIALAAVLGDRLWFAVAFGAFPISAIVSAFVYGTRSRRQEREERARIMAGRGSSE